MIAPNRAGLSLTPLESRLCPTFNIFYTGSTLNIIGYTDFDFVNPGDGLILEVVSGGSDLQVRQFSNSIVKVDYGTYRILNNLNVRLARYDTDITLDLNGGRIPGHVNFDLGIGDTDANTLHFVSIIEGEIGGNVRIRGGNGLENINLGDFLGGGGVDVAGHVFVNASNIFNATNPSGSGDVLNLNDETILRRSLITNEVDSITVGDLITGKGIVNGDVILNVSRAQGNVGQIDIYGKVGGNVVFVGNDNIDPNGNGDRLTVNQGALVAGNISAAFKGGALSLLEIRETADVLGSISHSAFGGDDTVIINGNVNGSISSYMGTGNNDFTLGSGPAPGAYVGGNINITALNGNNVVDFGSAAGVNSFLDGNLYVHFGNGDNLITITDRAIINGDLVRIQTGSGKDQVEIDGLRTFRLHAFLGAGADTLTLKAGVGSATIDFGLDFDSDVWNPPPLIDFPLVMINIP